jgi:hypothetical protein
MNDISSDVDDVESRHADGIGPNRRADAEHAQWFVTVGRFLSQELRGELRTLVKVEDDHDPLSGSDISQAFQIPVFDD